MKNIVLYSILLVLGMLQQMPEQIEARVTSVAEEKAVTYNLQYGTRRPFSFYYPYNYKYYYPRPHSYPGYSCRWLYMNGSYFYNCY